MCDYMKVVKGQVFWFDPAAYHISEEILVGGKQLHTNLQLYRRPYLVVGSTMHDPRLVNIAPITSSISYYLGNPCCVQCNLPSNEQPSMILLNKIMTVDTILLNEYLCTLTPATMEQVDIAMATQFGLSLNRQSLDIEEVIDKLQDIVGEMISSKIQQAKVASKEEIDNAALSLAATLETLMHDIKIPTVDVGQVAIDSLVETKVKRTIPHRSSSKATNSSRNKSWSMTQKKEFLEDYEKLSTEEMIKKYNYKSKESLYTRMRQIRRDLNSDQV